MVISKAKPLNSCNKTLNDSGIPLDENKVKQKVKNLRRKLNTPIQSGGYNKIKPMFKRVNKNTTNEWSL